MKTSITTLTFIATLVLLTSWRLGHNAARCVLERSRLLEISLGAHRQSERLRQQMADLLRDLENVTEQFLTLGEDHFSLLRKHETVLDGQREMLADLEVVEEQRSFLKVDYQRLLQEKGSMQENYERSLKEQRQDYERVLEQREERYLRLNGNMEKLTGEMIDLHQRLWTATKEKGDILEDFSKTLKRFQERYDKIVKDKDENYRKISEEKMKAENRVKVYRQVLVENKKIQKFFDYRFKVFLQDRENMLKQKEEKFLQVIRERDSSEEKLRQVEKDHRIMLKEKGRMEEQYERRLQEAATTIDVLRQELKESGAGYLVKTKDGREESSVYHGKLTEGLEGNNPMQRHSESPFAMAVELKENMTNEAEEKCRIIEKERDSLQQQLNAMNKSYEAALEDNVNMREYYERAAYIATLTIDRNNKEMKEKCPKPVEEGEGNKLVQEGEQEVETRHEKLLRELKKEYNGDPPEKMTDEKKEEEGRAHDNDDLNEFEKLQDEDEEGLEKESQQDGEGVMEVEERDDQNYLQAHDAEDEPDTLSQVRQNTMSEATKVENEVVRETAVKQEH